jgi:F-BAR domain only protein
MPWQRIVSGTENLAQSHETLAAKIETDIEAPLRQFQNKNREMTGMTTIQGNLASISKDFEIAQKKADKLKDKGSRGDKYANAAHNIDGASREWEAQAPYVFEQLQALDESRCNHLRDVLTQFQTHEIDQVERNRVSAESSLNALLNIETADEIKTFAARVSGGRGSIARRRSSATASTTRPMSAAGPPPTPPPPRQLTETYSRQSGLSTSGEDRLTPCMSYCLCWR